MMYHELLNRLYQINIQGGVKLGIESMRRLSAAFNDPHTRFLSIHVAGSNGKGTVSAKIAKGLESKYNKVGLYTSPHISSFRERIRINGKMISEEDVTRLLSEIIDLPGTFFELTTLLAFRYFAEQGVDAAVLETGLGGKLDATNVVSPALSVITSISLEHTDLLGHTLNEIASEKAGIIKPGVPVILGPYASFINASLGHYVEGTFHTVDDENRAIAQKALELLSISPKGIQKALTTRLPCRLERISYKGKEVILDVAHNPHALERLFQELTFPKEQLSVVCGLSSNKDLHACLETVQKYAQKIHLVKAPGSRGTPVQQLKEILLSQGIFSERIHCHTQIGEGLKASLDSGGHIAVIGTFFIMKDARRFLGIEEPQDPFDLNENFNPRFSGNT